MGRGDPLDVGAVVGRKQVRVGLVHGDFAPYNMGRVAGGRIFLFDWEMACRDGPELFDFLHWTLFVPLLMKTTTPSRLIQALRAGPIRRATQEYANLPTLALLYLTDRLTRLRQEQDLSPSLPRRTQIEALEVIALALVESSR